MLNEIVLRRRNKLTISNGEATQPKYCKQMLHGKSI